MNIKWKKFETNFRNLQQMFQRDIFKCISFSYLLTMLLLKLLLTINIKMKTINVGTIYLTKVNTFFIWVCEIH